MTKNIINKIAAMLILLLITGCVEDMTLPEKPELNIETEATVFSDYVQLSSKLNTNISQEEILRRGYVVAWDVFKDTIDIALDGNFEAVIGDNLIPGKKYQVYPFVKVGCRYMRGKTISFSPVASPTPVISSIKIEPQADSPVKGYITIEGSHLGNYSKYISVSLAESVRGYTEFFVEKCTGSMTRIAYICANEGEFHLKYTVNGQTMTLKETLPVNINYEFVNFSNEVDFGTPLNIQVVIDGKKPQLMGCLVDGKTDLKIKYFNDDADQFVFPTGENNSTTAVSHTYSIYYYSQPYYIYLKDQTVVYKFPWKKLNRFNTTNMGMKTGKSYPKVYGTGLGWQMVGNNGTPKHELYSFDPANSKVTKYVYNVPDNGSCLGSGSSCHVITDGNDVYCLVYQAEAGNKTTNKLLKLDVSSGAFSVISDIPATASGSGYSYYAKSGDTFYLVNQNDGSLTTYNLSTNNINGPKIVNGLVSPDCYYCGYDDRNIYYLTTGLTYRSLDNLSEEKVISADYTKTYSAVCSTPGAKYYVNKGKLYNSTMSCSCDVPSMTNHKFYGFPKGVGSNGIYLMPIGDKMYCMDSDFNVYEYTGK